MKRMNSAVLGIILIVLGVIFGLNALDITDIDVFFDGWWTLFIIVPSFIGMFNSSDKTTNFIFFVIGFLLLLSCQDILRFSVLWDLLLPGIIVIIGIKFIMNSFSRGPKIEVLKESKNKKEIAATFSEEKRDFDGEDFKGAELNAIFGSIKCDLRKSKIKDEAVISVTSIFGGADILVPDDVNVIVKSTSIFGGVDNHIKNSKDNKKTLYIYANCLFGGVEIK